MTKPCCHTAWLAFALFVLTGLVTGQEQDPKPEPEKEQQPPAVENLIANGNLEAATDDKPPGWRFVSQCEGTVSIDTESPFEGKQAALLDASEPKGAQRFTNLMQALDAAKVQGKRLRFRAAVRVPKDLAQATRVQLWFRVDRPKAENGERQMGAFDNMQDRPIRGEEWQHYDIVLDVADDATMVNVGMFVIGKGKAWIDDASLTVVDSETETTVPSGSDEGEEAPRRRFPDIPESVRKALASAADAPQQPFFTWWLLCPCLAIFVFVFALWPRRPREVAEEIGGYRVASTGLLHWYAISFTMAYWLLYTLPGPFSQLLMQLGAVEQFGAVGESIAKAGTKLNDARDYVDAGLASFTANTFFGIEGELVPPNGSGDTTQSYLTRLNHLVFALVAATVFTFAFRRYFRHRVLLDLLRSYNRYVLAFAMLGYGLAKTTMEYNQFPEVGDYHLARTWGDSSPMGVVWSFMGASRPYTIFAGLSEVVCAMLLIWRRTSTLGAMCTIGVMTNVVMINFCYDVPVKLYSSHLLVMAVLVAVPDVPRIFAAVTRSGGLDPADRVDAWSKPALWWTRLVLKLVLVGWAFLWPVYQQGVEYWDRWFPAEAAAEPADEPSDDDPLLTRRGYRWINEVPFNR